MIQKLNSGIYVNENEFGRKHSVYFTKTQIYD